MKKITLAHLKVHHKARVVEILGCANLQNRLMSMGLHKGKEVTKLSHIGLRGPVVIKTGRSILAVGRSVATKILVDHP